MKKVILTVGPRGAGKTTFCEAVVRKRLEIEMVSRDRILKHIQGSIPSSDLDEVMQMAYRQMWMEVRDHLAQKDCILILDCWNGDSADRARICQHLYVRGATSVEAWRFTTPLEKVVEWFMERERREYPPASIDSAEEWDLSRREDCISEYHFFHSFRVSTHQGFTRIRSINPVITSSDTFEP